jgi:hypothetical protein
MSDEKKTYTLEEVRARQMEAFGAGWDSRAMLGLSRERALNYAKTRYPSPKKLREVKAGGLLYRSRGGELEYKDGFGWHQSNMTRDEVRAMNSILEHPYEDSES